MDNFNLIRDIFLKSLNTKDFDSNKNLNNKENLEKVFSYTYISQAHLDEVLILPKNIKIISYSDSCSNEIMISED